MKTKNNPKQRKIVQLIVEKGKNELWGRVKVNYNLIVDVAPSLSKLSDQIKMLILDLENIEVENFKVSYDLP